jgi:hypothetical protein
MPSWYNGAASYDYYGSNVFGSYTIHTYGSYGADSYDYYGSNVFDPSNGNMTISNVSPYEASKRFTLGRIYQAFSKATLYDDMGYMYSLDGNEIECFEEVDIGLNEISKRFMEKHINSGKMAFQFNFLNNNKVILKMILNGKYSTWVSLMGVMGQENEMLHNAYIELRKRYINKVKNNIETSYKWHAIMGHYIYDIETCGQLARL